MAGGVMLAFTDVGIASLMAASRVPHAERGKWLREIARDLDPHRQVRNYRRRREGMLVIKALR